jgi:S-adenosylmethionine synthetase
LEQEDYLKRQIDQLARVLGKILFDLMGFKTEGQIGGGLESANAALQREMQLSFEALCAMPTATFIETLQQEKHFSNEHMEQLAEILLLLAEDAVKAKAETVVIRNFYERAMLIYEHLEQTSDTYSFEHHILIEQIKKHL